MKAIVTKTYGIPEVLELTEVDKPEIKDDEVLIRNYGTSINTADIIMRTGKAPKVIFWGMRQFMGPFLRLFLTGLKKPRKILGYGFSGVIESIGKDVTQWNVGDHVYGFSEKLGAYAEYLSVPMTELTKKPSNLSFQEAAAVPGGATPALLAFRDLVQLKKGQKVLIIGASGGVGTFAVQIAKNVYGVEVTGICGPTNVDMVKEIGADYVFDYTKEDYTKSNQQYDIIFDAIGANTFSKCRNLLTKDGFYISNNFLNNPKHIFHAMTNLFRKKKLKFGTADEGVENLNFLREWAEQGKIKPVIDTVYPLNQIAEAHRHYETGHARGRIVVSIE